jgi:magnesium chelatase family protein
MLQKYARRLSGPLLDRIDLHVNVDPVAYADLSSNFKTSSSVIIRNRVIKARSIQVKRTGGVINALMAPEQTKIHCALGKLEQELLIQAMEKQKLSARSYARILKVARTIADLDAQENIRLVHLAEAIALRCFDGDYFNI